MDSNRIVTKVSVVTVTGNVLLSFFKFFAGVVANSGAMISDAVHSLSDIITTVVAYYGVKMSNKEADKDHPYGHERLECVAGLALALILFVTGAAIGYAGFMNIIIGNYSELEIPGILALVAAGVSIIVKEAMFWYTRHYAIIIKSSAFMADAWHHRTDAISSVGALIGIGFAIYGFPIMDSVASVVICLFIFKASYDILIDALRKLTDRACSNEMVERIRQIILAGQGVLGVDVLKTRLFGNRIYVEAEIRADGNMTLWEAHEIAESVHDSLEANIEDIKHVMIHVNPCNPKD